MSNTANTLITKLGTARKVERSRIWIEGKRLTAAGFTVGCYFHKDWNTDKKTLTLILAKDTDVVTDLPAKVSGKGDKPIIDITGECVRSLFPNCEYVEATFTAGRIVIKAA